MFPAYRNMMNLQALRALTKAPVMPPANLAVAGDDEMSNVPLIIFRDQHLPLPQPVTPNPNYIAYEKSVADGSGQTLSMDNFVTDDFQLGPVFDT